MGEVPSCRKTHLLVLFLLFLPPMPPRIIPQWCCCLEQQPIWCGGCHANDFDADKDSHRHLIRRVLLITWYKTLCIPMYITTHNQPSISVDVSWSKWSTAATLVPHSQCWCRQQLPRMLADYCMRQCWEQGTMAAVGRRRLPWSVRHGLTSFS